MELFGILLVLGLLACLLIGFIQILIWVGRLFSGGSKPPVNNVTPKQSTAPPRNTCHGCGATFNSIDLFCMQCGLPREAKPHSAETDLVAAQRALLRLFNLKRLDENLYQSLTQIIEIEQARLREQKAETQRDRDTERQRELVTPLVSEPVSIPPSMEVTPVSQSLPLAVSPSPAEPRRSLPEMLAAFMEESSIRWGELVGGLLIIGCSLALVVSLWSEIAERPWLKFGVFMFLTMALFGLGFYSAHRWKLPTTSRGVMLTATLLVPLNFLAVTALGSSSSGVLIVIAEIIAWFVFAALVWRGGQVYAAEDSHWIMGSTMGASLALLAAKHLAAPTMNWRNWLLLGALPVACFGASVALSLRQARKRNALESTQLYSLFAIVGTGLFASLLPLGLLLARGELTRRSWQELVPLLALLGVPLMAVGWFCWRRIQDKELATERTIATSLGIAGAALLAGGTLLAFPFVDSMLAAALLSAVVFGWAAWRYGLRAARSLAFAQTLYASLLILHLALGRLSFGMNDAAALFSALFSYATGLWLFVVTIALIVVAEYLRTRTNTSTPLRVDTKMAAAVCALASFVLVTYHGFGWEGDPRRAVWVYAAYTLTAFVWAWRHSSRLSAWLGLGLLWMTSVQACVYSLQPAMQWIEPWAVAWSAVALFAACLMLFSLFNLRAARLFGRPALLTSGLCTVCAAPLLSINPPGYSFAYLMPGFITSLVWAIFGWRTNKPVTAFGGGLLLNLAASLAALRWIAIHNMEFISLIPLRLVQINLAASAIYALLWYGITRRSDTPHRFWIVAQSRVVTMLWLALLGTTAALLIAQPWRASMFVNHVGGGWSWALAALVTLSYVLIKTTQTNQQSARLTQGLVGVLAVGVQTAALLHRFEGKGEANDVWMAYFTLSFVATFAVWLALAFVWRSAQRAEVQRLTLATKWTNSLSVAAVLLAWRGTELNRGPWRSVAILFSVTLAMLALQWIKRARAYAYVAGALACGTLTLWIWGYAKGDGTPMDVLLLNGVTLAAIGLISLLMELRNGAPLKPNVPAFHRFIAFALLACTSGWMATKLFHDFTRTPDAWLDAQGIYSALFFTSLAALLIAGWWDAGHRWRFATLYVFGLLVISAVIDRRNLYGAQTLYCLSLVAALYATGAALLWRSRSIFLVPLQALRVPALATSGDAGLWWLTAANALLATASVALALFLSSVMEPSTLRVVTALTSLLAPLSLWLLIAHAPRWGWQWLTLTLAFGATLACLWLGVSAHGTHQLVLFTALSLSIGGLFYLAEARPLANWPQWLARMGAWESPLRQFVTTSGSIGVAALLGTLALEWAQRLAYGAPQVARWAAGLVTVLFIALLLSLLAFALWGGRDPLRWEAAARSRYVYAAELTAVLLFIHLRLVAPWMFGGRFQAYWPVAILLLAFAGVALSELLRRRGRTVLADPLERTGVFLPLLPSLAFSLVPSTVDYAGLLLGVALFYGVLSVMRQSFGFGLLAVLAGNGGWWHWLQRTGDFGFFAHPQLWLIPAALSVLIAAHLNRKQLSLEQLTTIRYVALMTIYVSSTADIFLNGVADSPWLPLILAVLAIAGVMMGMMLRIRAYLFLGTSFLLLAVITMIWHAAVSFGWRWLWYVAGIAFGMAIIYLFAMFERHRTAWLLWMERFKTWQA